MTTIAYFPVNIRTSVPSIPAWFGEVTLRAHHLNRQKILQRISEQVRFARHRFGRYEVIDFVAVLFGYAVSSERTLEAFYEQIQPWASAFMALFGRDRLPARSTFSRFLASLDQAAVEALRTLFLHDLLARPLVKEELPGGLWDRHWNRRHHRRAFIQLLRHQCVKVEVEPPTSARLVVKPEPLSRAEHAHYRLSWTERLARNARPQRPAR